MSLIASIPFLRSKFKSPRQVYSTSWKDYSQILEGDINLFCWKRPVDIGITSYLGQLLESELPSIIFSAGINELHQEIEKVRPEWDSGSKQAADLFWKDVYSLVFDFLSLSESNRGTVHLKVIDNNACSKFHTDGYSLRLFTTYYGKGTEWLPENATNRKGLGKSNDLIIKDSSQVQRMEAFEVGILKGEIPDVFQAAKGIVHRSPEIASTGEKRIILRVDV
ncbi:MAG: DUF1826 domain-containing protein [Bacteroidota bacterium]